MQAQKIGFWTVKGNEIPVDPNWKKENYKLFKSVVNYLNDPDSKTGYRGWSNCRICKKANGSEDYHKDGFTYPSGYVHYIVHHCVVPDPRIIIAAKEAGY